MKRLINLLSVTAILVSITLISCEKGDNKNADNCNVSNPAEEIAWLKEAIDNVKEDEYSYFVMAKYKGETVFYYGNCDPVANYISIIQNCSGDNLGFTNDFQGKLTDVTILWKHENSKCILQE